MPATYFRHGQGYSLNGRRALEDGRASGITNAAREVRAICAAAGLKVSVADAKRACETTHDGEWHHVGKYAARVNFYDVQVAALLLLTPATVVAAVVDAHAFASDHECICIRRADGSTHPAHAAGLYETLSFRYSHSPVTTRVWEVREARARAAGILRGARRIDAKAARMAWKHRERLALTVS